MTSAAISIVETYKALPTAERDEVLAALLRVSLAVPYESAADEELLLAAEEVFLELDRRELQ